jgi:hypothetical protein
LSKLEVNIEAPVEYDCEKQRRRLVFEFAWITWLCHKIDYMKRDTLERKLPYDSREYDNRRNMLSQDKARFKRHAEAAQKVYQELCDRGAVTERINFYYGEIAACIVTVNEEL